MKKTKKKRIIKIISIIVVLLIIIFAIIYNSGIINPDGNVSLTYDQVITYVKNGDITKIDVSQDANEVTVVMKDGTKGEVIIPSLDEFSSFVSKEIENGSEIEFKIEKTNKILNTIVSSLFTLLLYLIVISILLKKMYNIGGNYDVKPVTSNVTFKDVAGIDEEKEQLIEIIEFLKNPKKYTDMGARIPKGILLNGDPGTGKTLLAKAIAGEAGVPFISATGSSFEEKFVGVGASRVRKLFKKAKKLAPCIIFIDELDSVAESRYTGKSYSEQTLNQLLSEMDGFDSRDNIIVIAATNHIEVLDSAITRPGRFDRQIFIPKPDVIAREEILKIHARNKKFAEDVSLSNIAKKTVGFSGADLQNILNEATIYAVNQGKKCIFKSDIDEAIARVLIGLQKKNAAITDKDKRLTSVHEAGHAIVSAIERPEIKNFGISIIPRGRAGGYNFFDEFDSMVSRKSDMLKQIQVLYGGRAAEQIILGDISDGAANDLERASRIAHLMVTKFAMDSSFLVKIESENEYNQQLDIQRMKQAEKICKDQYDKVEEIIESHKDAVNKLSNILYEKEYLTQEEVSEFIKENLG